MSRIVNRGPPPCVPEVGMATPCGKTACDKVFCIPDLPPATELGQPASIKSQPGSSVLALRTSSPTQEAFVSAQTAGLLASLGDSATALYPWDDVSYSQSHVFTNEAGLPRVNEQLNLKGGAAIGVGGAILDLGSVGADLVVSVDANPKIGRAVQLFTGMLLALPEENPAEQLLDWLVNPDAAQIASELKNVGVDTGLLKDLPEFLQMTCKKLGANNDLYPPPDSLWCRGPGADKKVKHLQGLARRGRIIAVRSDLADPRLAVNLKKLVSKAGVQTKLVHLSNALDYIPDIRGVCNVFSQVNLHPEAQLTTSASARFSAVKNLGSEATALVDELGKPGAPAVLDAHAWLDADGRGQQLHDAAWGTQQMRDVWWQSTCSNLKVEVDEAGPAPASLAEYRERVAQLALR